MAKPQKSTAQSEVPGLVKKGPLYYLKRDWQLYALMLLPMVFIIVFKYFAYTGLSERSWIIKSAKVTRAASLLA